MKATVEDGIYRLEPHTNVEVGEIDAWLKGRSERAPTGRASNALQATHTLQVSE